MPPAHPANQKRVCRIVQARNLLLARHHTERSDRGHNAKVVTMRSNPRWCSDGFEFTCRNGDIVRGAFIIGVHDREIMARPAVTDAGISGSDVRDMMLAAVEARPASLRWKARRAMASRRLSAITLKRDHVNVTPLPDAVTDLGSSAGWFDDYNENHLHPEL